jgi:hypothetical protein
VDLARASGGIIPSVFLFELGRHAMLCQRWKAGSDAYEEFLQQETIDNREYAQVAYIRVNATLLGMYEQGDRDISPTITRLRSLFSSAIINQLHTKLWGPLVSRHKALAQAIIDFIADLDLDTKSGAISSPFASEALFGKGRQNFVLQQCSNCGVVASAPLRVDRTKKPREELDVYLKKCSRCFQVCPVNVFCSLGLSRFSLFFCCVCISLVSLCLSGPDTP